MDERPSLDFHAELASPESPRIFFSDWFPPTKGLMRAFADGGSSGKAADESSGGLRCIGATLGVALGGIEEVKVDGPAARAMLCGAGNRGDGT